MQTADIAAGGATFYQSFAISQTLTGDLSYYSGDGLFAIGATTETRYTYVPGRSVNTNMQIGGSSFLRPSRIVVDFDEAPAVPEPSAWALMLAGIAMTGYALRRKVAFA